MVENKVTCPKCGNEDYPSNTVCWQCGAQLVPQASDAVPTPAHTPSDVPIPNLYKGLQNLSERPVRPLAVSIISVFECIGGGLAIIAGLALFFMANSMAGPAAGFAKFAAFFCIALGAGIFYVALQLWHGANWARIVFIVLSGLGVLSNLGRLMAGPSTANASSGVPASENPIVCILYLLLAASFLIVLLGKEAKAYCTT